MLFRSRNYNTEISRYANEKPAYPISEFINMDATRISWTAILRNRAKKGFIFPDKISYECDRIACYRPFVKSNLYFDKYFNENIGLSPYIFPNAQVANKAIVVSGVPANKGFSSLILEHLSPLDTVEKGQGFPLYWYEENKNPQASLFDDTETNRYIRRDGITDWILKEVRNRFGGSRAIYT